eukprot:3852216-Pyramimonas_sp.AAC.1
MRTVALWPWVEPPYEATKRCTGPGENAQLGFRHACGRGHWGLGWSSLWGHGATERCTGWVKRTEEGEEGHETLYWVCGTHAD